MRMQINGDLIVSGTNRRLADLQDVDKKIEIVESGKNTNGEYIKLSDGRMYCFQSVEGRVDITTTWGSLFQSTVISTPNFPSQFIEVPYVVYTNHFAESVIAPDGLPTTAKPENVVLLRGTEGVDKDYKIDIFSMGRWK